MAFSVNEFRSQINKRGLAVTNLFVFTMTPPQNFADSIDARELTFFCQSVQIPSHTINFEEYKTLGYGPGISYPTVMNNESLSAVFMVDADMEVLKFFHRWQQFIYNYNSAEGPLASNNNQMVYELNYKKEYVATVTVDVYSSHIPDHKYTFKYFDVWPTSVTNGQFAWNNGAEVFVLPVQFKYSRMTNDGLVKNVVDTGIGASSIGFTSAIGNVGSLINNIGSIPQNLINNFATQLPNIFRF